jgi:hypothetical protein
MNKSVCYIAKSPGGRPTMVFIDETSHNMVSIKPEPGAYNAPLFVPIHQVFEGDEGRYSACGKRQSQ